jgi:hypothetical protein
MYQRSTRTKKSRRNDYIKNDTPTLMGPLKTRHKPYRDTRLSHDTFSFSKVKATKGLEGSRGIALLILNFGVGGVGWSAPRPGRFTPG